MSTLADRLLDLLERTTLSPDVLPHDVQVLDPMRAENSKEVQRIVRLFHERYYTDDRPRLLMLGINPGRLGAGSTGLPFTDTKRCENDLDIAVNGFRTHEPSSDLFYRVVRRAGGAANFYRNVYVHSICPLGFVRQKANGTAVNLNYYDDKDLEAAVTPFLTDWLHALVACGMRTDTVLCIGTGKNQAFLERWNAQEKLFGRIVPLEHPRYIIQYKAREMDRYIDKYLTAISDLLT